LETKTTYLNNINYFRGIAIIFIVFGHCITFGITHFYENTTFLAKIIKSVAPGGTTFFVFISGYLFHHIYYKKFQLGHFLFKKIKYVLLPFLLFSSLDIFYYLMRFLCSFFFSNAHEVYLEKIKSLDLIKIYLLGHSEIPIGLWYVPFIMVVFSLSKFYIKFVTINYKTQLWIISILMIISIIIHRTHDDRISGIFQNVLYFTPVYLLGIFVSKNNKIIYSKIIGKAFYLLLITLIITIFQVKIGKIETISELKGIGIKNLDFMVIQKSLLSIFFIVYLMKFEYKKISLINLLAANSFGIFFIHGVYIWLFNAIVFKLQITFTSNSILTFFLTASLVLALSLLTTILIKKFLKKKSKYIIGC
jgi:surface polysaccharide O-acyltransferase-like enzyme